MVFKSLVTIALRAFQEYIYSLNGNKMKKRNYLSASKIEK